MSDPVLAPALLAAMDRAAARRGIPEAILMENAGAGAARLALARLGDRARDATVVCGTGNNGGDGLVLARHLALAGGRPRVVLVSERPFVPPAGGAFRLHLRALEAFDARIEIAGAGDPVRLADDVPVVDALLGTGLRGAPRPAATRWIAAIEAAAGPVLALDLPSGLDAETGACAGAAVTAALTATFAAVKPGLVRGEGPRRAGEVVVVPISLPPAWLAAATKGPPYPWDGGSGSARPS